MELLYFGLLLAIYILKTQEVKCSLDLILLSLSALLLAQDLQIVMNKGLKRVFKIMADLIVKILILSIQEI